jgi:prolyl-tRNA synthetase
MKQSALFGGTLREISKEETSSNAILLQRGGYVVKAMAGVYSFLPLGLRVMHNLSRIVREEMNKLPHTSDVVFPAMQPRELWEESGRWEEYGEDMYRLEDNTMGLGPTHEEVATTVAKQFIHSYRDLPTAAYQIQTKFRRELRAKSGLLRGREFLMKDLYSFHLTEADLLEYYGQVKEAYLRIYTRAGLQALYTEASGGLFSKFSHEFQVLSEAGEDTVYLSADGKEARNKEIVPDLTSPELAEYCGGAVKSASAVEVGNIFPLNLKFSKPMQLMVSTEDGERVPVWMGCYGIGISRLMGVITELMGDVEKGSITWPAEVAPFAVHLIDLVGDGTAAKLHDDLVAAGVEVLYDDRPGRSVGERFADADLVGAPVRLLIGKKSLAEGKVEVLTRATGEMELVELDQVIGRLA